MDPVVKKVLATLFALVGIVLGVIVMVMTPGPHFKDLVGAGILAVAAAVLVLVF